MFEFLAYWRTWAALVVVGTLLCAPFVFVGWKTRHLRSYALAEMTGATCAVVLLLPWDAGIFDVMSYLNLISTTKVIALLGAIYFGVRGVENLKKANSAVNKPL